MVRYFLDVVNSISMTLFGVPCSVEALCFIAVIGVLLLINGLIGLMTIPLVVVMIGKGFINMIKNHLLGQQQMDFHELDEQACQQMVFHDMTKHAVIHQGRNDLSGKAFIYMILSIISVIFSFISFFLFLIPVTLIMLFAAAKFSKRWMIYRSGLKGEKRTLECLKELPGEYTVFTNVKVHEHMEVDAVVAGPNGVFVIETKNYKGRLAGREQNRMWLLHKTGRRGGEYTRQVPNPLIQLKKNIFILSKYLKMQESPAWVEGCVVFPSEETAFVLDVGCDARDAGVLGKLCKRPDMLKRYILGYQPKRKLDSRQLGNICDVLSKCLEAPAMMQEEFEEKAGIRRNKDETEKQSWLLRISPAICYGLAGAVFGCSILQYNLSDSIHWLAGLIVAAASLIIIGNMAINKAEKQHESSSKNRGSIYLSARQIPKIFFGISAGVFGYTAYIAFDAGIFIYMSSGAWGWRGVLGFIVIPSICLIIGTELNERASQTEQ